MQIHELELSPKKSRKRVGRGGKRGTYSGRGVKGQKSRSGGNVDPLFEGGRSSLVERMKKVRGVKAFRQPKVTVTLAKINRLFEDGDVVSIAALVEKKILSHKTRVRGVKVVASGDITKKVTISDRIAISQKAYDAIIATGGSVEESSN